MFVLSDVRIYYIYIYLVELLQCSDKSILEINEKLQTIKFSRDMY